MKKFSYGFFLGGLFGLCGFWICIEVTAVVVVGWASIHGCRSVLYYKEAK